MCPGEACFIVFFFSESFTLEVMIEMTEPIPCQHLVCGNTPTKKCECCDKHYCKECNGCFPSFKAFHKKSCGDCCKHIKTLLVENRGIVDFYVCGLTVLGKYGPKESQYWSRDLGFLLPQGGSEMMKAARKAIFDSICEVT